MPLTMPSANKKPRAIKWDAEPALPRASAGWEKVVAIGFATALGAGAVALATILMVVSPAESEWQPRPLSASMAPPNNAKAAAAGKTPDAAPASQVTAAAPPVAKGPAPVAPQAAADTPADAVLAAKAPAEAAVETVVATLTPAESIALPNEQRWARSVPAGTQQPDAISRLEAAGAEAPAQAEPDEQRVAAIPLSALVAEPIRPAEPEVESAPETAEPAPARKLRLSSSANLRSRPANGAKVLGTISGGTSVASFGCKGGWCEVSVDGKRGFIASRFLGEKSKVRRASAAPAKKKATPKNKKSAPQRKAAAPAAAVEQTEKAPLPGVFPTVPTTSNGDR